MSWTYNVAELSVALNQVRFLITDTDSTDPLMQDEEIQYILSQQSDSASAAAVQCCEVISRKFARLASYRLGQYSVDYSRRAEMFSKLASDLKKQTAMSGAPVMAEPHAAIFDIGMMNADIPGLLPVEED